MADQPTVFGTVLRDRLLVSLLIAEQSHVSELADAFGMSVAGVAKAVRQLERDGLVVGESRGRTRLLHLNVRWFAKTELRALLGRVAEARPEMAEALQSVNARRHRL